MIRDSGSSPPELLYMRTVYANAALGNGVFSDFSAENAALITHFFKRHCSASATARARRIRIHCNLFAGRGIECGNKSIPGGGSIGVQRPVARRCPFHKIEFITKLSANHPQMLKLPELLQKPVALATSAAATIAPLATRVLLGLAFYQTGTGKWGDIDKVTAFFTNLGIPAPAANAYFVSTLEVVGGIALIFGIGTRAFAALLASTMVVALLTADRMAALDILQNKQTIETNAAFTYLLFLGWLAAFGAGALSVDRIIANLIKKRNPECAPCNTTIGVRA